MSRNTGRLQRVLGVLIALIGLGAFATTAFAHSGLGAASPAPGSRVGGEITEMQLRYSSTVVDVDGSVTDPDGNVVESEWVQDGNLRVAVTLTEPLSIPGQYAVRHISTDVEDGDRVEAAYLFTYDPAAPPPQLEIIPEDDGFPWIWVVIGVGGVVIALLAWQLYRSMQRARLAEPAT
jgi:methionine-rich copper-binding protein CopC